MAHELNDYPSISINPENLNPTIDLDNLFGRTAPIHIEVGSGKGTFLVHQATAQPEVNFLGIEWASKFYRHAVDRIGRWGLTNVRLLRTDAVTFFQEYLPEETIDCFHIYFPDPWPKKRHNKRRFFNSENLTLLLRLLKPNGVLRVATDHLDYFQQIQSVLAEQSERLEEVLFPPTASAKAGEWVGTNFERKYLKEERSIYKVAVQKKPEGSGA